jgi:lipopolysaccharide export system protein LptA
MAPASDSRARRRVLLPVLFALFLLPRTADAQSLGFGAPGDQTPVEVLADNGIEWMRDGTRFVAKGNAAAARGDTNQSTPTT